MYRDLPGEWVAVGLRPFPIQQGQTVSIYVANMLDGRPTGSFAGQPLHFFPREDGFVALVGLDAFTEPGQLFVGIRWIGRVAVGGISTASACALGRFWHPVHHR